MNTERKRTSDYFIPGPSDQQQYDRDYERWLDEQESGHFDLERALEKQEYDDER